MTTKTPKARKTNATTATEVQATEVQAQREYSDRPHIKLRARTEDGGNVSAGTVIPGKKDYTVTMLLDAEGAIPGQRMIGFISNDMDISVLGQKGDGLTQFHETRPPRPAPAPGHTPFRGPPDRPASHRAPDAAPLDERKASHRWVSRRSLPTTARSFFLHPHARTPPSRQSQGRGGILAISCTSLVAFPAAEKHWMLSQPHPAD